MLAGRRLPALCLVLLLLVSPLVLAAPYAELDLDMEAELVRQSVSSPTPTALSASAETVNGMPVVDDESDDVPFVDSGEVLEDNLTLGTPTGYEVLLSQETTQTTQAVSENNQQDDTYTQSCSLWTTYDDTSCISRTQFKSDFTKLSRRFARKQLNHYQADAFLGEYLMRLRNAWMPGMDTQACTKEWVDSATRTKCLVNSDAILLGKLLAAFAEDMSPTDSGILRSNSMNYTLTSEKCCHRLCNAVTELYTNTDLMHTTCCTLAPSKCANYY